MDIYTSKSRWKIYLAAAGIIIVLISMVYTNYLAGKLTDGERSKATLLSDAYREIISSELDEDMDFQFEVIKSNTDIPIIIVNNLEQIEMGLNFSEEIDTSIECLDIELASIKKNGFEPIPYDVDGDTFYIYYKQSYLLTLLSYFPLIQILLFLAFVLVGYIGFSTARRAEQNQVWVGMAKETAHQLGTPITAIVAWIEHLKLIRPNDEETMEIVHELNNDVERLNLIADRFSKIGSSPDLVATDLYAELEKCCEYMIRRAPRRVSINYPKPVDNQSLEIPVNPPLFDWVIENLLRNALDAMEAEGRIDVSFEQKDNLVEILVTDTGKGIPSNKHKMVFQPGFTTKKRGWGLGLSLAKRIIESYHKGKISVLQSAPGKGTTFSIQLPLK